MHPEILHSEGPDPEERLEDTNQEGNEPVNQQTYITDDTRKSEDVIVEEIEVEEPPQPRRGGKRGKPSRKNKWKVFPGALQNSRRTESSLKYEKERKEKYERIRAREESERSNGFSELERSVEVEDMGSRIGDQKSTGETTNVYAEEQEMCSELGDNTVSGLAEKAYHIGDNYGGYAHGSLVEDCPAQSKDPSGDQASGNISRSPSEEAPTNLAEGFRLRDGPIDNLPQNGSAEDGQTKYDFIQDSLVKNSTRHSSVHEASEYGAAEDGETENCSPSHGLSQFNSPSYGSLQNDSPQRGSSQNFSPQNSSLQRGSPQYDSLQYSSSQITSPQYGSSQQDLVEKQNITSIEADDSFSQNGNILDDLAPENDAPSDHLFASHFSLCRPTINTCREYIPISEDAASSLFDKGLDDSTNGDAQDSISFLFCGVGDARNLIRTIIRIAQVEMSSLKKYHFTITDNKFHITRNLILFLLLEKLVEMKSAIPTDNVTNDDILEILTATFFIYLGRLLPQFASKILSRTVERALQLLEKGHQPLKTYYIHSEYSCSCAAVLRRWRRALGKDKISYTDWLDYKPGCEYKPSRVDGLPQSYHIEENNYITYGVLTFSDRLYRRHPFWSGDENYIKWSSNVTLYESGYPKIGCETALRHNPFCQIGNLVSANPNLHPEGSTLCNSILPIFNECANSLWKLKGRIQIEAICGDHFDPTYSVRLGDSQSLDIMSGSLYVNSQRRGFPTSFNRIHLSGGVESCGGCLLPCLCLSPLLKTNITSYLALRQEIPQESTALPDPLKTFLWNKSQDDSKLYYPWFSRFFSDALLRKLSRDQFNNWFVTHFFRLCLPSKLDPPKPNLIVFFHMAQKICESTPHFKHWVNKAINDIVEGSVIMISRPSTVSVLKLYSPEILPSSKTVYTKPYSYELDTLRALFWPSFPFLETPSAQIGLIFKFVFKVHTTVYLEYKSSLASLTLVFWDDIKFPGLLKLSTTSPETTENLRDILDPMSPATKNMRKLNDFKSKGLIIWSTFEWNMGTREVSVWMSETLVEMMANGKWAFGVWNTHDWLPVCTPAKVIDKFYARGEVWPDE